MDPTVDVDAAPTVDCADEPIRVPGSVQPHGFLLAADVDDLRLLVASAGTARHLGVPAEDLLGRPLGEVIGQDAVPRPPLDEDSLEPRTVTLTLSSGERRPCDVLAHEVDGLLVVEVEPHREDGEDRARRTRTVLRALQRTGTEDELTAVLAREVRALTGFDRVLVYRFDARWDGEVVAEDLREGLDPYLGLHYPASDIPAQARALYTTQWLRSIPDAGYTPDPLVPATDPRTGRPFDLSGASLRSVSPVHLQYLANMGVRASMSISLIVHGRLWGLVSCHHESGPHYPDASVRGAAEFYGRTASLLLQGMADAARNTDDLAIAAATAEINRELAGHGRDALHVLTEGDRMLRLLKGATGAAARIAGRLALTGRTPSPEQVDALYDLLRPAGGGTVVTDALAREHPGLPDDVVARASGVLVVPLVAGSGRDFVAWFRPEVLREVHWAGDPGSRGVEAVPEGLRLSPRASFAEWVEQVRGTSDSWTDAQVAAATRLGQDLDALLTRRRGEQERVAAALRRIVLTERPPTPPGYGLAQRFVPSGDDAVGGDWYDVTALPDRRIVLTVGDVAGHGIGIAAITAQIRHALRAYLVDEGNASDALRRISHLIATLLPDELATVVSAELDPATGCATVSRAGHLPVLHVSSGDARFVEGADGPALGLGLGFVGEFTPARVPLAPGDCLVMYTDGLVEQRGVPVTDSLERIRRLAQEVGPRREALCDALVSSAPPTSDDVTLLVLQRE